MITYHSIRPSSIEHVGSSFVYNFFVSELPSDDPHRTDGLLYVAHTQTAMPSDNPAEVLIRVIDEHDSSQAINSFLLNGMPAWIDKSTRVGLVNSINIEKAAGHETTTLWFEGNRYVIPCDMALQLLSAIELYAIECYGVTAQHIAKVSQLASDFTAAQNAYSSLLYPQDGDPEPSPSAIRKAADTRSSVLTSILNYDFTTGYPARLIINI